MSGAGEVWRGWNEVTDNVEDRLNQLCIGKRITTMTLWTNLSEFQDIALYEMELEDGTILHFAGSCGTAYITEINGQPAKDFLTLFSQ